MQNTIMQAEIRLCEDGFYGICVKKQTGKIIIYDSVTKNREALEVLVHHINEGNLSEIHIYDIIEDIIG